METIFQVEQHKEILSSVATIISVDSNCLETKLTQICALLKQEIKTYDWVGFYFAKQNTKTLHLKAFSGIPTDHTVIPFGKGICGQVAISNKNFVVDDVHAQDNYISCNIDVKSEIVIPLFLNNENIGQIDIDSNTINAFNESDVILLEKINEKISNYMLSNKLSINIS
ncbi:GAF domain-containing protein [Candidatus Arcticimaribacter forsetii]|uniref:GAF domain-containing protein n=1 Tax=Candidatus Arcticimaribacter forsetii TaxID=2820661 RepID=UPI003AF564CC